MAHDSMNGIFKKIYWNNGTMWSNVPCTIPRQAVAWLLARCIMPVQWRGCSLQQDEEQPDQGYVGPDDWQDVLRVSSHLGEAVLCAGLPALVVGVAAVQEVFELGVGRVRGRCNAVGTSAEVAGRGHGTFVCKT